MSDAYILVKGTISVTNTGTVTARNNKDYEIIFKNFAPFTNCIIETNNTQINNAKEIDVDKPIYDLI